VIVKPVPIHKNGVDKAPVRVTPGEHSVSFPPDDDCKFTHVRIGFKGVDDPRLLGEVVYPVDTTPHLVDKDAPKGEYTVEISGPDPIKGRVGDGPTTGTIIVT
jgi:hypothetical protein